MNTFWLKCCIKDNLHKFREAVICISSLAVTENLNLSCGDARQPTQQKGRFCVAINAYKKSYVTAIVCILLSVYLVPNKKSHHKITGFIYCNTASSIF